MPKIRAKDLVRFWKLGIIFMVLLILLELIFATFGISVLVTIQDLTNMVLPQGLFLILIMFIGIPILKGWLVHFANRLVK